MQRQVVPLHSASVAATADTNLVSLRGSWLSIHTAYFKILRALKIVLREKKSKSFFSFSVDDKSWGWTLFWPHNLKLESLDSSPTALPVCEVCLPSCCALLRFFFHYLILLSNVSRKCCIHMYHDICTEFFIFTSSLSVFDIKDKYKWWTNLAFPVSDVKGKSELILIIRWLFPQNVPLKVPAILTCTLNHFSFSQSVFSRCANFPQLPMKLWGQTQAYSWDQILWHPVFPFPFLFWNAQSCKHGPRDDML